MNDIVKEDILQVFAGAIDALKQHDYLQLSNLSNQVIHDAMIYQDEDSLAVAVLLYALGKLEQRAHEQGTSCPNLTSVLQDADGYLAQGKVEDFRKLIKQIIADIGRIDEKMHLYIEEVLQKARLKKGSKLHEHGLTIARASEMLGISQWELMSYVGKSEIPEDRSRKEDARKRYKAAKELFR
jgi:hypothetical protein